MDAFNLFAAAVEYDPEDPEGYECGVEEWLIVLDGSITVRHPDGERTYERGD